MVEKLEQSLATVYTEYSQNRGQKTREEILVGSMAHTLKSPSYEGYTAGRSLALFTEHVFQQSTENSK